MVRGFIGNYLNNSFLSYLINFNEDISYYILVLIILTLFLISVNFNLKKIWNYLKLFFDLFNKDKNYTNKNEIISEYIPQDEIKDLIQEDLPFIKADKIKQNEKLKYSLPDINLLKTPSKNERDDSKKDERSDPVFLEKILLDFGVEVK